MILEWQINDYSDIANEPKPGFVIITEFAIRSITEPFIYGPSNPKASLPNPYVWDYFN